MNVPFDPPFEVQYWFKCLLPLMNEKKYRILRFGGHLKQSFDENAYQYGSQFRTYETKICYNKNLL